MLGGGRKHFKPSTTVDIENEELVNDRLDGRDLVREWLEQSAGAENRTYVTNAKQLKAVDPLRTDKLLGMLFIIMLMVRIGAFSFHRLANYS